ncbi:hypothetical protein VEE78_21860 [Escherichia coli]|nr:hypothetical protein VEGS05_22150 [Escherichia coli]BEC03913.1 hypothetical protein VEE25_04650 [Escherichia coli]BED17953.1 hypothetical protein VEE78_21860 [Escherichia coli]
MTSLKTSIKTITYLSDIGCLEIQGASLISASNGSQTLAVSIAGADAVITGQKRAWQTLTAYPLAVDQSYYYTFVKPGETTPTPVTNAIIPLQVSASIANDLGGSEKIELDGKAVISVVYL